MENHFIITTKRGTRWAATGASFAQVRREFFLRGRTIQSIERGRLFSEEEEAELKREKDDIRWR